MNTRLHFFLSSKLLATTVFLLMVNPLFADTLYWGSPTSSNWTTAGNWYTDAAGTIVSGAAPTAADDVIFSIDTLLTSGATSTGISNSSVNSITVNNTGSTLIQNSTGSGSQRLTVFNGITNNGGALTFGQSSGSMRVVVGASQTFTNNSASLFHFRQGIEAPNTGTTPVTATFNAASSGNIDLNVRALDGTAGAPLSIVVDSTGTGLVRFANTTSTFSGGLTVKSGGTNSSVANSYGANVTIGNTTGSANVTVGSSAGLSHTTNFTAASGSSGNLLSLGVNNSNTISTTTFSGNIILNNNLSVGYLGTQGTPTINLDGVISGTGNLTTGRLGAGTRDPVVVLNGANTYTGKTTVTHGSISVGSFNSVAGGTSSSSLGAPTTVSNGTIAVGSGTTATGIIYTGSGEETDRVIDLASSSGGVALTHSGTGHLKFTSNFTATGGGAKTLTLQGSSSGTGEIAGAIVNSGGGNTAVTKTGTGKWTLSGANTYGGQTTVSAGTLEVAGTGSVNSSSGVSVASGGTFVYNSTTALTAALSLANGATLKGSGNLGVTAVTVGTGVTISPGNSPGTLATGSETWGSGGTYVWEINNTLGAEGSDEGWDLLDITGNLSVTANAGSRFTIDITSLTTGNAAGLAANFNSAQAYSWTIARASGSIIGFDPDDFTLNTTNFQNNFAGGSFSITTNGGDLNLVFTPVPEPGVSTLFLLAGAAFLISRRRQGSRD